MKKLLHILFFFLLVTQICFAQWMQIGLEDKAIKDIAARNSNIFAISSDSGSVYRSTNNGNSWTVIVDTGAVDIAITSSGTIFLLKKVPFYSYFTNRLFSSSDNGATWDTLTVMEQIIPPPWSLLPTILNVSVSRNGIVNCGISIPGWPRGSRTIIASSTDDGITWTTPGENITGGRLFDYKDENVISAGYNNILDDHWLEGNDIYLSTDNGSSWTDLGMAPIGVGNCRILSLCLNGNILLGDPSGLYISADSCTTWTQVSSMRIQAGLSIESGGTLVGTDSLGVFLFSDNGDSLGSRNDGLTNLNVHSLTTDNNGYVYAGTDNGVWRRLLSEITSVDNETTQPTGFILSQNYPNPFNPSTKIKYQIPIVGTRDRVSVQLKVFDVLGNKIETLINEEKSAGTYELTWNAEILPSGVYFYQLSAGSFVETKKMILLR